MMTIKTNTARLPVPPPKAPEASAARMSFDAQLSPTADDDTIPGFARLSKEQRAEAWKQNPPKAAASAQPKETTVVNFKGKDPSPELAEAVTAAIGHAPLNAPKPKKAPGAKKPAKAKTAKKGAAKTQAKPPVAKKGKVATKPQSKAKAADGARKGTKLAMVAGLLQRKNGCSRADVLEACKWPSVSMPAMAKAAGLKLTKEKAKGQPTRYYGA